MTAVGRRGRWSRTRRGAAQGPSGSGDVPDQRLQAEQQRRCVQTYGMVSRITREALRRRVSVARSAEAGARAFVQAGARVALAPDAGGMGWWGAHFTPQL